MPAPERYVVCETVWPREGVFIEELASAMGLGADDLMAMTVVYVDDSGTHLQSDVAVAACLVSDVRRWADFELVWREALQDFGLAEFHMTDFFARVKPYDGWTDEKRADLLKRLIRAITEHVFAGVAAGVVKSDYDRVITGKLREKLGQNHFTFSLQVCLAGLEQWQQLQEQWARPMEYIFDLMSKGKREILDLFDGILARGLAINFGVEPKGYGFQNHREALPLQAVDILAWEASKHLKDYYLQGRRPRKSFESLCNGVDPLWARFYGEDNLKELAALLIPRFDAISWAGPVGMMLP